MGACILWILFVPSADMNVQGIQLQHFRSFTQAVIEFDQVTILVGPNGSGKTSVLEALHLLSTGSSFRAGKLAEMIRLDKEYARLKIKLEYPDQEFVLEIALSRGVVNGAKAPISKYWRDGAGKRKKDVVGTLLAVSFKPEDLRLIEGSKARRRAYLDEVLSAVDPQYAYFAKINDQILRKRNKLLLNIQQQEMPRSVLGYWDAKLIEAGEYLQTKRANFVKFIQDSTIKLHDLKFSAQYLPSLLSKSRLAEYSRREVAAGHTLIGPHKDDLQVFFELPAAASQENLATYGSRGQQRLGVLWLKLQQQAFLKNQTGQNPVVLLDDIWSELDKQARDVLVQVVQNHQTIITTTELDLAQKLAAQLQASIIELSLPSTIDAT